MIRRDAFFPYRRDLKARSQALRRDPSPAERRLWYDFLRGLPHKADGDSHFTTEAMRRDAARTAALEALGVRVVRLTNQEVMQDFEGACRKVRDALSR